MADLSNTPPRTADQARHRIDTGVTGEKVDWPDPAASPLWTDAEASGNSPTGEELETDSASASSKVATPRRFELGAVVAYCAIAAFILAAFLGIVLNN